MQNSISFFLNGKKVTVHEPDVDTLLIDYLRSPGIHLAGPKKPCGQGGCGGCTVILSRWDAEKGKAEHRAINSCLRPLAAVEGMVVTTVEGTGAARRPNPEYLTHTQLSSRGAGPAEQPVPEAVVEAFDEAQKKREQVLGEVENALHRTAIPKLLLQKDIAEYPSEITHIGMNPVAHRMAINNGTQCGYCTVGFVMNMSEFIANNPKATQKQIEDIFDGNICRCTGYRPILTGMKTFASDWTEKDEEERMKCLGDDSVRSQLPASSIVIPFPDTAKHTTFGAAIHNESKRWTTPLTLGELLADLEKYKNEKHYIIHANTGYGIYPQEFLGAKVIIDVRLVPELNSPSAITEKGITVASGTTYTDIIAVYEKALAKYAGNINPGRDPETMPWGAALFMAKRTAGRIVRNAGSIGGNTMLVLKHIAAGTGDPFPSDMLTALAAIGAEINFIDPKEGPKIKKLVVDGLSAAVIKDPALANRIVILSYFIPFGDKNDIALAQKVALRDVNSHSIVNSTSLMRFGQAQRVTDVHLIFGGLVPYPWRAVETEKLIMDKDLSLDLVPKVMAKLRKEAAAVIAHWEKRMHGLPSEGFTEAYKIQLATSFLYKAFINALLQRGAFLPPNIRSGGEITWGRWPVSNGLQYYKPLNFRAPLSKPYIKFTAVEQAQGQLHYTHELAVPVNTINGSLVQSTRALANYHFIVPGKKGVVSADELRAYLSEKFPAFIDLVTSDVFKNGSMNMQGMGSDQPIFAIEEVNYVGQSIALVGAMNEQSAASIAGYVSANCVGYTKVTLAQNSQKWWNKPVLGIDDAIKLNSIYPDYPTTASFNSHIWQITRPGSDLRWLKDKNPLDKEITSQTVVVNGNVCQLVGSTQLTGGQAHFYMETQAAIAEPADGGRMIVHASTQSPATIHGTIAQALGVQYNSIDVRIPPVGGGFGGKTEPARFVSAAAAVAAKALKRPVRLVLTREQDTAMIGKRHAYYSQGQIAIDKGETTPGNKGLIQGLSNKMWGDGGAFYDCSFIVSNCIITRGDNAYRIPNFQAQIDVCRTNTAPSTAMRAFGDVQGKLMLENIIDDGAFSIGMTAEAVREKNLYDRGDVTPFGQPLTYCYMKQVWAYLKQVANFDTKVAEVEKFNAENKWRKRGLSMVPVKYGSGYNLTLLEQSAAYVSIFQGDGSIVVHQGGVEMGQGLLTQVRQVASYILNVPMALIEVESPKTNIIPNPTSTGASTGTTYSAEAVKRVCQKMRSRMTEFGYDMLKTNGNDWCVEQGIDFWNHGVLSWRAKPTSKMARHPIIWQNLVSLAYNNRVSMICGLGVSITGGETPVPNLTYKPIDQQPVIPGYTSDIHGMPGDFDSFSGFTYSAACTVAEVDILTGETKIISTDIVYDAGWSMNPAIDIGQVEGAFIQGVGYVLSEKLVFEPEGENEGRLNTLNTWTYKPPATTSIPLELNVHLYPRDLAGVPENPSDILSAKEIGEPPLVLSVTAFFAVKAAVRASRVERGLPGLFILDSPATVQETRRACEVGDSF